MRPVRRRPAGTGLALAGVTLIIALVAAPLVASALLDRRLAALHEALTANGATLGYADTRRRWTLLGARVEMSAPRLTGPDGTVWQAERLTAGVVLLHPASLMLSAENGLLREGWGSLAAVSLQARLTRHAGTLAGRFRTPSLTIGMGRNISFETVTGRVVLRLHPPPGDTRFGLDLHADTLSLLPPPPLAAFAPAWPPRNVSLTLAVLAPVQARTLDRRILVQRAEATLGPLTIRAGGTLHWPSGDGDLTLHGEGVRATLRQELDHPPPALRQGQAAALARLLDSARGRIDRLPEHFDLGLRIRQGAPDIDLSRLATLLDRDTVRSGP
ncbi:hypothetical protein [Acidomonas methanolica]|uniref:DUF2125 domain-containing protein n=1 Tax=Acidomonas methanolica NBRC 104435 TaxID=1231351 RepID=A0A023D2M6_ACIMT|nr:hypothetical protein [Acidomonas methanolica]MBU2654585.1 DUF2125 domain-containing protein [Acidomonas methanolica]TCS27458.1 hypothetical protein EDC31_11062 [Acidomonas methanolica]GAJ28061.1 hypothetical protein Amme_013_025 [Acidomonas methanolica NBRC 104435]GBQ51098.1 hypothetical protein AA0498_1383 [Acidomonas methanolica]GEK98635.1 hypothetical protein AME01nite_11340 [Acidomonas methanolica NBRC 104435]